MKQDELVIARRNLTAGMLYSGNPDDIDVKIPQGTKGFINHVSENNALALVNFGSLGLWYVALEHLHYPVDVLEARLADVTEALSSNQALLDEYASSSALYLDFLHALGWSATDAAQWKAGTLTIVNVTDRESGNYRALVDAAALAVLAFREGGDLPSAVKWLADHLPEGTIEALQEQRRKEQVAMFKTADPIIITRLTPGHKYAGPPGAQSFPISAGSRGLILALPGENVPPSHPDADKMLISLDNVDGSWFVNPDDIDPAPVKITPQFQGMMDGLLMPNEAYYIQPDDDMFTWEE